MEHGRAASHGAKVALCSGLTDPLLSSLSTLDFGTFRVELHQQQVPGYTVGTLWECGLVLAHYLADSPVLQGVNPSGPRFVTPLAGKRVLELGAGGCLLPSLVCAKLGARVVATDLSEMISLQADNCERNGCGDEQLQRVVLDWSDGFAVERLRADAGPFDFVLLCDVVYQQVEDIMDALIGVLKRLCSLETTILLGYRDRGMARATDSFWSALLEHFEIREEVHTEFDHCFHGLPFRKPVSIFHLSPRPPRRGEAEPLATGTSSPRCRVSQVLPVNDGSPAA